jgi:hypothetical protein
MDGGYGRPVTAAPGASNGILAAAGFVQLVASVAKMFTKDNKLCYQRKITLHTRGYMSAASLGVAKKLLGGLRED